MRKIQLQPLTAQDIPVLHALLNEPTIMDALHMRPTTATLWQDAFAAWENDADEENYLITSDHQPVGWMRLNGLSDKPDAWLSMLAVGTAYQRQGIGRQAVLLAETILQGRGYRQLRIHTSEENLAAQHCYRSLRYAQTERLDCTSADGASRMEYTYRKTLAPDMESIRRHWYAYAYDQLENQTDDVTCMLKLLGNAPKQLLEVCCGGGRILVPLAKTGHTVTGFDMDEDMLACIPSKAPELHSLRYYRANALSCNWGRDFDVVVLAGNVLINIETAGDYETAQRIFLCKAANALRPDGLLYLDFCLYAHPETFFEDPTERIYFEITDDAGIRGRFSGFGGTFDARRQLAIGKRRVDLTLPNGETHSLITDSVKHIPTLFDVHTWLANAGFTIDSEYGGYDLRPIGEDSCRAIICARKKPQR